MASIYKRKRIYLPKIIFSKFNNINPKKNKKIIKFCLIILIMVTTFFMISNAIKPVIDTLCKDRAKSVATIICNEESTKIISNYKYEDLITIHRDKENNIVMIQSNIIPINYIISDVGEKIQKRMNETHNDNTYIKLGTLTGSKIFAGYGPNIPIKLALAGNVETDLRSEFKSHGINQTIHRIYLQVDCKVSILTPYNTIQEKIHNQVLLAENIIVGKVPETFYELEGLTSDDAMEVME